MSGDVTLDTIASAQLCTPPLSKAINNPSYKPIPVIAVDYPERLRRYPLASKGLKQGIYRQGPGPEKSMQIIDPHLVLLPTSSHYLSALPNPLDLYDTVEYHASINGKEDPAHSRWSYPCSTSKP